MSKPIFPQDHALEAVRGKKHLPAKDVRHFLARRCLWLSQKIAGHTAQDPRAAAATKHNLTAELVAVVQAMEAFDKMHPEVP